MAGLTNPDRQAGLSCLPCPGSAGLRHTGNNGLAGAHWRPTSPPPDSADPLDRHPCRSNDGPQGLLGHRPDPPPACPWPAGIPQPMPEHERLPDLEPLLTCRARGLLPGLHRCLLIKAQLHGAMGQHDWPKPALKALEISGGGALEAGALQDRAGPSSTSSPSGRSRPALPPGCRRPASRPALTRTTSVPSALAQEHPRARRRPLAPGPPGQTGRAGTCRTSSSRLLAKALNNVADQHLHMKQASLALKAAGESGSLPHRSVFLGCLGQQLQTWPSSRLGRSRARTQPVTSAMALSGSQGRVTAGLIGRPQRCGEGPGDPGPGAPRYARRPVTSIARQIDQLRPYRNHREAIPSRPRPSSTPVSAGKKIHGRPAKLRAAGARTVSPPGDRGA